MLHILYLVPHVPNPTKIRSHFQVQGLKDAGHRVTVATLIKSPQDAKHVEKLREKGFAVIAVHISKFRLGFNALRTLFGSPNPLQSHFFWSPFLWEQLKQLIQTDSPDVIHVEHLRMAEYGLKLLPNERIVWDAVDYLSSLYQQASQNVSNPLVRAIYRLESKRLASYEPDLTARFPKTLVISAKDQALFQQKHPQPERVIYHPQGLPLNKELSGQLREENTLVITGTLNYHPNVTSVLYFVNEIFPLIRQKNPNVRLKLVGANPDSSILKLQADPAVEITGFVPSVLDYLGRASIALAPITYGSGIQIKVLEAFMTGTPLVATSTALRGLDVQHEQEVWIADTPQAFADAVLDLLKDAELRARLGEAGRKYVVERHDLQATTQSLIDLYTGLFNA
ncbi:MAG: glycosyltransferase [Anaerolineae bacterium]|nr:glycosyltransferase [Anaerolineae bacterium]